MAKETEDHHHLDCGGCSKSLEEVIYWKHVKRLRFCVSLRPDFQDKLPIPKKFAENMKPDIFHPKITLRGPSGASWDVTLVTSLDGLFLQDGWEEFVSAYSLQENDILFFKYDRNSSFDVKIFNGQCEKEAAYFVKKCGHVSPAVKDRKKTASVEIVDDDGNGNEVRKPNKKARNNPMTPPLNEEDGFQRYVGTLKKILSRRKPVHWALHIQRKKAVRSSKELQGEGSPGNVHPELAKDTNRNGPDTNQNGSANKEAFSVDKIHPEVNEICTSDTVQQVIRKRGRPKRPLVSISAEPELTKDTNQNGSTNKEAPSVDQIHPEVTEICTSDGFQKVIRKSSRPKRTLSPKKKTFSTIEYVSHRRPVTEEEKTEALRKAASELDEKSFFAALPLSSCYKGFLMTVPAKFASEHFHLKNEDVILRVGERKWLARFNFRTNRLVSGWRQFALDNHLEESDACLFKLVSQAYGETMMLDVTIFRVVEEITPLTLPGTPLETPTTARLTD